MGRFTRTLLIGVGIGLLFAPKRGVETRQLLKERFQQLRTTMQQNPTVGQVKQALTGSTSSTESQLKQVARQAEPRSGMTTPATSTYEPAFPEYVNPEKNTGS